MKNKITADLRVKTLFLTLALIASLAAFTGCKKDNPYSGKDPGAGIKRLEIAGLKITSETLGSWEKWHTIDGRILPDTQSTFEFYENPFEGETGSLVKLTTYFDPVTARRSFGGFGIRAPFENPVEMNNTNTFIEFDLYYPFSAAGKYMRMDFWSSDTGGDGTNFGGFNKATMYIRTEDMDAIGNLNPDWLANYNNETWSKKRFIVMSGVSGTWKYMNIDIHTETGTKVEGDILFIGNIKITRPDPDGVPIPNSIDTEHYCSVMPIKEKYNKGKGLFTVGTIRSGYYVSGLRARHFEIFVDGGNLKAVNIHPRAPQWLRDQTRFNFFGTPPESMINGQSSEYYFPTEAYMQIRDSGNKGEFKSHGHVLAWYNQAPAWMRQIIPLNLEREWNSEGRFYSYGNNATGPFYPADKNIARRVYFNHILYTMRHFMTTDSKYGSSEERGVIPFDSFDVINEEIHESRHSVLIRENPDEWKSGLKSTSWLAAMTDNDFDQIDQHYIYLLFKYAHIAVPNALMAQKYKTHFDILPPYMKLDEHDNDGNIDAYITENPPRLVYNEYDIYSYSKAKMAYNMVKELNTAWLSDPLYDGRHLIEVMGIQGHDAISPTLASDNQRAVAMYASLIDEELLSGIVYSELDLKIPDSAPGGGARAPAILNKKQADTLGYQYALLYMMFTKYAKYIDHIIHWGSAGVGWQNSYVLFNLDEYANKGYYAIMEPEKYIKGHSYLNSYFAGEYEKIKK